jgi:hypothetical protein
MPRTCSISPSIALPPGSPIPTVAPIRIARSPTYEARGPPFHDMSEAFDEVLSGEQQRLAADLVADPFEVHGCLLSGCPDGIDASRSQPREFRHPEPAIPWGPTSDAPCNCSVRCLDDVDGQVRLRDD